MEILAFFYFDPMYFVYLGSPMLLAMWAQMKVKSAYAQAGKVQVRSGLSGAETAQRILNAYSIADVAIEPIKSFLGDHYDPKKKVLRLSPDVYNGRSLASVGIAAHEVGHAIQHAKQYGPLVLRSALVPTASIGTQFSFGLVFLGLIMSYFAGESFGRIGQLIAAAGVGLFGVVALFQLVNLPIEFNASSRARAVLIDQGIVTVAEDKMVAKVLNAAAMTYVAATFVAIANMLYYASMVFGRRD